MPRRSRIDAPGALHHIIVRGIERKPIFKDDADKDHLLERLGNILTDSEAPCFADIRHCRHWVGPSQQVEIVWEGAKSMPKNKLRTAFLTTKKGF